MLLLMNECRPVKVGRRDDDLVLARKQEEMRMELKLKLWIAEAYAKDIALSLHCDRNGRWPAGRTGCESNCKEYS
jgi:hypothetical protein